MSSLTNRRWCSLRVVLAEAALLFLFSFPPPPFSYHCSTATTANFNCLFSSKRGGGRLFGGRTSGRMDRRTVE